VADDGDFFDNRLVHALFCELLPTTARTQQPLREIVRATIRAAPNGDAFGRAHAYQFFNLAVTPTLSLPLSWGGKSKRLAHRHIPFQTVPPTRCAKHAQTAPQALSSP
jgi:hypothetical protein